MRGNGGRLKIDRTDGGSTTGVGDVRAIDNRPYVRGFGCVRVKERRDLVDGGKVLLFCLRLVLKISIITVIQTCFPAHFH